MEIRTSATSDLIQHTHRIAYGVALRITSSAGIVMPPTADIVRPGSCHLPLPRASPLSCALANGRAAHRAMLRRACGSSRPPHRRPPTTRGIAPRRAGGQAPRRGRACRRGARMSGLCTRAHRCIRPVCGHTYRVRSNWRSRTARGPSTPRTQRLAKPAYTHTWKSRGRRRRGPARRTAAGVAIPSVGTWSLQLALSSRRLCAVRRIRSGCHPSSSQNQSNHLGSVSPAHCSPCPSIAPRRRIGLGRTSHAKSTPPSRTHSRLARASSLHRRSRQSSCKFPSVGDSGRGPSSYADSPAPGR